MQTGRPAKATAVTIVRWMARLLSVLAAAFFLFMFIGESLAPQSRASSGAEADTIGVAGVIGLWLMGLYCLAMLLALHWERIGSALGAAALGCFFIMLFLGLFHGNAAAGFSARGVLNPYLLVFWVPVLLYQACQRIERRRR